MIHVKRNNQEEIAVIHDFFQDHFNFPKIFWKLKISYNNIFTLLNMFFLQCMF